MKGNPGGYPTNCAYFVKCIVPEYSGPGGEAVAYAAIQFGYVSKQSNMNCTVPKLIDLWAKIDL
jgi:hypothetical protein